MGDVNLENLGKSLGDSAIALIKSVGRGGEEDLKTFGAEISKDMLRAVKDDRPQIIDELRAQLPVLGEMSRIRLNGVSWDWVANALGIVTKAARGALLSAGVKI
jgi:hypothetical protein